MDKGKESHKQFIITKKVAKQGKQVLIVVPKALENQVKPGSLAKITIDILEDGK